MTEETNAPKKPGRPPAIKPKPVEETPPVEKVNTGDTERPLVDAMPKDVEIGNSGKKCPDHPKARAVLYGMCVACYDKLSKMEKRKLYLTARLHGSNTHNYPNVMLKTWRRELVLIGAGLWKKPIKAKSKTMLAEEIMG